MKYFKFLNYLAKNTIIFFNLICKDIFKVRSDWQQLSKFCMILEHAYPVDISFPSMSCENLDTTCSHSITFLWFKLQGYTVYDK